MPLQTTVNTRFVLKRDEFSKASRLALRKLSAKIKWAGMGKLDYCSL